MPQSVASQDLKYGGSGATIPTVAINAAGGLFFAALFTADQQAADTRISRRDKVPCLVKGLAAFLTMRCVSDTRHPPLHGMCEFMHVTIMKGLRMLCVPLESDDFAVGSCTHKA